MSQVSISPVNGFINFTPSGVFFADSVAVDALCYVHLVDTSPVSVVNVGSHTHDITELSGVPFAMEWEGNNLSRVSSFVLPSTFFMAGVRLNPLKTECVPFYINHHDFGRIYSSASYSRSGVGHWSISDGCFVLPATSWLNSSGFLYSLTLSQTFFQSF